MMFSARFLQFLITFVQQAYHKLYEELLYHMTWHAARVVWIPVVVVAIICKLLYSIYFTFIYVKTVFIICLQCFDTVSWASGRMSDEVLMWLCVWSEVQIVCIWSSWCHCIPKPQRLFPHLNPDWFYFLVQAYSGYHGKEAVKWV